MGDIFYHSTRLIILLFASSIFELSIAERYIRVVCSVVCPNAALITEIGTLQEHYSSN
ncbi:MAG: hypothetical protein IIU69_01000 [Bacteroidaceae bacterium]|nr:hypothetical protein [Bacteroidaceae bacterium]